MKYEFPKISEPINSINKRRKVRIVEFENSWCYIPSNFILIAGRKYETIIDNHCCDIFNKTSIKQFSTNGYCLLQFINCNRSPISASVLSKKYHFDDPTTIRDIISQCSYINIELKEYKINNIEVFCNLRDGSFDNFELPDSIIGNNSKEAQSFFTKLKAER